MKAYKKAWAFIAPNKIYLLLMMIFLVIFQFFNSVSPLVIRDILDNQILGITGTWYEADEGYTINGLELQRDVQTNKPYTISYIDDQFYLTTGILPSGVRELKKNKIVIENQTYKSTLISKEEMRNLFASKKGNLIQDIILLVFVLTFSIIASYLQRLFGALLTINATKNVRLAMVEKFEYIDIQKIEAEPAGKMANRLLTDSLGISSLYTSTVNIFISSVLAVVFSFIGMYLVAPKGALLCLVIIPIMIIWIRIFTQKINKVAQKVNETNSQIIARMNEIINGISILKIFNSEQMTVKNFRKLNEQYVGEKMDEVDLHLTSGWNGINLFQGVVVAIVIGAMAWSNLQGVSAIQAGTIYVFYSYISKIIAPLGLLFHEFGNLEHSKVKIERVFKILDTPSEEHEIIPLEKYLGNVKFENVNFSYNAKELALKNINIDIRAGQRIGLVGRSGSGKSTIINLLMRFNDLNINGTGRILIDGIDIDTYNKRTYRQHLGMILQEPIIFQGTLATNIKFGSNASDEEIIDTLKILGAEKVLEKFNNDIHSKINNAGANLSLGERQLISLSRVLIRDPQILIMDEATANIDTETEKKINYALDVVAKNRTVIIVAHRLSTIVNADQILVLEDGEIIERGNHDELLELNGNYMQMYRNQVSA